MQVKDTPKTVYGIEVCTCTFTGLQIRVRLGKLFSLFLLQNICFGYSKEPSLLKTQNTCLNLWVRK